MPGFALRMISIFLTAIYTFATLRACGVDNTAALAETPGIPAEESPKAVYILQSREDISYTLQKAADRFTATGEKLAINIQTVSDPDYNAALRTRLLSGDQTDLFHITGAADTLELLPYLEDLSSHGWIHTAMDGTLDAVSLDGAVYGVPYSIEGTGLIANRNIFEVAGIPLGSIEDFEDLSEALSDLNELIADGDLADAFPDLEAATEIAGQDAAYLGQQWAGLSLGASFSDPFYTARTDQVELPAASDLEELIKLLARYSANRSSWANITTVTQSRQLESGIAKGRVAMILQSSAAYHRIFAANPDLEGRLALLPIPMEETGTAAIYTRIPVYWAVNRDAAERTKREAGEFLEWLYCSEEGAAVFAREFAALSVFRETAADTGNTLDSQLLRYIEQSETIPLQINEAPGGWSEDVFAGQLQEYFTTLDKTWEEVVEACTGEWTRRRGE